MLIAIEGIDGSGKGTQAQLLMERFLAADIEAVLYSFPQYGKNPFGTGVGRYLNGDFGNMDQVSPELASLLYAGDRFVAKAEMEELLARRITIVCDRYIDSNLAHQVARVPPEKQAGLTGWIQDIEYGVYQIPRPDLVVYLDMPVDKAIVHVNQKMKRRYTDKKADLHEADPAYLQRTADVYKRLISNYDARAVTIECRDGATLVRKPEYISQDIWNRIIKFNLGQDPR